MSKFIPNQNKQSYQSQRTIRRSQNHQMNKIIKKYGPMLPIPSEEDIEQYIKQKSQEWQKQEEKQTN